MSIEIDGRKIGEGHPPYIVAELSANHNGDIGRALQAIDVAQRCGASAIKLQTYTADTMTIDSDREEYMIRGGLWDGYKLHDLYKWAETPYAWHAPIFEHARSRGITVFSTPFDETAVDLLESLDAPAYKIASFEILDLALIRYAASTRKPMILSTGMSSEAEIEEAVDAARSAGCGDLVLLHCISSYPAPIAQANLRQIAELSRRFGTIPGLSDHTMGNTCAIAAVALGACLIEKHFTLDRSDHGPDSAFSMEPAELERLCADAFDAWTALGHTGYTRQQAEAGNRQFRRSIVFVQDIPAGTILRPEHVRRIRPGLGLDPKHLDRILGRKLKVSVTRGMPTSWELFDE